jgi:serine/threonine protein kinase/TolB-like protein/tetratricopeptide (TPR) repeat protein
VDTASPQLAPGTLIADRLVVLRHLGSGGLGAVYEVEHKFTHHHRAMKVLHPRFHQDRDVVERFLKEASAAGRIGNPHIVETFDAGLLPDGSPYVLMEFLEGKPLGEVLRWSGRLDPGLSCALLVQICDAVQAAHDANIIHRDLKPENLFLTVRAGEAFIKVLDFGISKFGQGEGELRQTRSGITMGTPMYMPPEQLKDARSADARSDVYSLGVILFEMICGHVPFTANSFAELSVKVLQEEVPVLDPANPAIPDALRAHVAKALQKDPALRFQSVAAFAEALAPLAQNRGVAELLEAAELPSAVATGETFVPGERASLPPLMVPKISDLGRVPPPPQLVASLRKIVDGEGAASPPPRRRWLLAFAVLTVGAVLVGWLATRPAPAHQLTSIAVLPFTNTTGDAENDYLSDGLAESVMFQLSRGGTLQVTPRSSVARARAMTASPLAAARTLGVDVVLVGELTGRQLVRAELIDVRTDALLWGSRWDRAATDLISIQRELAEGTLRALRRDGVVPTITAPQPSDPEAFSLYLQGRFFWNKRTADGLERAATHFREALDRDPDFAPAWVGLADSLALMDQYAGVPSKENCPKAKGAIMKALSLDPALATAHASRALLLGHCEYKWVEAEAEFKKAIELDPRYVTAHHWYALHLAYRGFFDHARQEALLAQQLDPLSLIANNAISVVNGYSGDWDAVLTQSERLIQMDPSFPISHMARGRALRGKRDLPGALEEFGKAFELSDSRSFELMGELGATEALRGDRAAALKWKARLEEALVRNPSGAIQLAMIAASLNQPDEAMGWLEKAFDSQAWLLVGLRFEPLFTPLRADPRFLDLVKRVKVD